MTSKINNAVRPEHTVSTVVATEEQQLLELVLQSRAPKKQAGFTLPYAVAGARPETPLPRRASASAFPKRLAHLPNRIASSFAAAFSWIPRST